MSSTGRYPAKYYILPLVRPPCLPPYPPLTTLETGFLTLTLYVSNQSPIPVIKSLSSALLFIGSCDYLRLRWPGPNSKFARVFERVAGFLMRESEKVCFDIYYFMLRGPAMLIRKQRTTNGVIWYILGVNFALLVYPIDIAAVAILMYVPPPLFHSIFLLSI